MARVVSVAIANSILREGLRRILLDAEFEIADAVAQLDQLDHAILSGSEHPILVVDRLLLGESGPAYISQLLRQHPELRVVVLAHTLDFTDMIALYEAGTYAYFEDEVPYLSLVAMMQMVSIGQKVAPPEVIDLLTSMPQDTRPKQDAPSLASYHLSDRECSVLECLGLGLPNKAISRELRISESVVKAAVKTILKKLSVQNRTQAAVMAREFDSQLERFRTLRTSPDAQEDGLDQPYHALNGDGTYVKFGG